MVRDANYSPVIHDIVGGERGGARVCSRAPASTQTPPECHLDDDSSHSHVHVCTRAYAQTRPPLKEGKGEEEGREGGKRYALLFVEHGVRAAM